MKTDVGYARPIQWKQEGDQGQGEVVEREIVSQSHGGKYSGSSFYFISFHRTYPYLPQSQSYTQEQVCDSLHQALSPYRSVVRNNSLSPANLSVSPHPKLYYRKKKTL
ncbi:hypothetical protein O181_121966 [Austropuccinia psidii MF-1]|uniref:Uncharacterized protein n=1 Tax=Austropuccinia psidii MF-1 TaxID=1389203 RepID=A0A9Q3KLE2_9BASI|nr:hypothetical protein [Austropuccinia psidii MF-1]